MKATFLDFRKRPGAIIRALDRNETVTVLYRGKPKAVMTPITNSQEPTVKAADLPGFGIWRDREDMKDVNAYVRKMRRGRFRDLR